MLTRFMIVVDCLRYLTVTHHDHEVRRMTPRPGGGVAGRGRVPGQPAGGVVSR
jgi:hypothetical protein